MSMSAMRLPSWPTVCLVCSRRRIHGYSPDPCQGETEDCPHVHLALISSPRGLPSLCSGCTAARSRLAAIQDSWHWESSV